MSTAGRSQGNVHFEGVERLQLRKGERVCVLPTRKRDSYGVGSRRESTLKKMKGLNASSCRVVNTGVDAKKDDS